MTCRGRCVALAVAVALSTGCGGEGDDGPSLPLGAECADATECANECLPQFTGGYCGVVGCTGDTDCPGDAACVLHTDAVPYCFRLCESTADCNGERPMGNAALCSDNIVFTDGAAGRRACVPPE